MVEFVHLHTHTAFSLLDGACRIDKLIRYAKEQGQTALAITDHGAMYGVVDFYKEAKKQGIKPILGCEVYVAQRSLHDKDFALDRKRSHLVLLAKNETGYRNLMKLSSIAHTEGFYVRPRVDKATLRAHSEGLICLSACVMGDIPQAILNNDLPQAKRLIEEYIDIFGKDDFYLEVQNHGTVEEAKVATHLVTLARQYGLELVATNDIHYVEAQDAPFQDVLLCIQTGKTVADQDRMKFDTTELYLKSGDDMQALFPTLPEAIANTVKIADRCNVELTFGDYHLPSYPLPPGQQAAPYLRQLCADGLVRRYGQTTPQLQERLDYELTTIEQMGFVEYFLIVWDFIKFAKDRGIAVGPGRGSAAGSLVAYCLAITDVDPIKYQLLFERFLNPERITMPDIDIDFCVRRRGEVLDYVVQKYGKDKVAQIITFGTLSARSVIRDVGRALNEPYGLVDAIAKMVPFHPKQTIDNALQQSRDLSSKYREDPRVKRLIDTAKELEGLPRHASTHAAGVVITQTALSDYVPLQLADETVITQFPMTTLEELGLLKMDFLGLRNLTIISDVLSYIGDESLTPLTMDETEPRAYDLIARGDTDGVFQLESPGMRTFMRNLKPACLEDLIAGISLYRPGPADSIPRYIANRNNPQGVTYLHPLLEPILQSTYGCIVYQEQVMQIVQSLAGYSLGRADSLRRAMGKKKPEVILREENSFIFGDDTVDGAVKRGVPEDVARQIFGEIAEFGKYAFNKSHAAAYAKVAYQTAYLKALYPAQFMCGLMSSQLYDTAKTAQYINKLPAMGIALLPPDINSSNPDFAVEGGNIRYGLAAAKNVGNSVAAEIVAERKVRPFVSMKDFCLRMCDKGLNKRMLEALIRMGAFHSLGGNRAQYLDAFERIFDQAQDQVRNGCFGQLSLLGEEENWNDDLADVAEFPHAQVLSMEKEVVGTYLSGHPMEKHRRQLEEKGDTPIIAVTGPNEEDNLDNKPVTLCGVVTGIKCKTTKANTEMAFVTLEDLSGSVEVILFPKQFGQYQRLLAVDTILRLSGRIDAKEDEQPKVILEKILPLEHPAPARKLYVKIPKGGEGHLPMLKELLTIHKGDVPVFLYMAATKETLAAPQEYWAAPSEALTQRIKQLLGAESDVKLV